MGRGALAAMLWLAGCSAPGDIAEDLGCAFSSLADQLNRGLTGVVSRRPQRLRGGPGAYFVQAACDREQCDLVELGDEVVLYVEMPDVELGHVGIERLTPDAYRVSERKSAWNRCAERSEMLMTLTFRYRGTAELGITVDGEVMDTLYFEVVGKGELDATDDEDPQTDDDAGM